MVNFFGMTNLSIILQQSLFLHLGTFFAALIYFRKDVAHLVVSAFKYRKAEVSTKKILSFLFISTLITGIMGILILKFLEASQFELSGKIITLGIGLFLLITSFILFITRSRDGKKTPDKITIWDSSLLGFMQGVSLLPGLSRSGLTISTLLLRKFNNKSALKLSFLMSLPVVLLANIFWNIPNMASAFSAYSLVGVLAAFVFGLLTIHGLMKLAEKINFAWFMLIFAILMLVSVLV